MVFKSSYPNVNIPDVSLTNFFLDRINKFGDKPALIDGPSDRTYTFAQLAHAIKQTASGLAKRGFGKNDVFAIYSPNLPEYAIAFHGIALIGGIVTTINPAYTADEIHQQLVNANAIYLVTVSTFLENAKKASEHTSIKEIFTFDDAEGSTPFSSLLDREIVLPQVKINPSQDLIVLPYSSGTTGFAKGVMLTHTNLVANILQVENISNYNMITSDDRVMGILPFFHIYGMVVIMNMSLVKGATIVTMPRFDMVQFLELIQKHKITKTNLVPPVLVGLAKHPIVGQYNTSSLIELFSGAAPLGAELAKEVSARLKCSVIQGYGLTETSPVTHVYNRSLTKGEKLGSIGPPVPNTEVMVVDPETNTPMGPNQRGEIWVRGPQVMQGYLNNPEATQATIDKDKWIHTGDIGYADEDGMFYIVDRLKELIKYKGFQVAPAELEALLLTHPDVADAAVIPLPNEEAGEIPKALLVRKANTNMSEEEIMDWVAARVSSQKKIRCVEFIDAIPKTASGKILRRVLRERERNKNEEKK